MDRPNPHALPIIDVSRGRHRFRLEKVVTEVGVADDLVATVEDGVLVELGPGSADGLETLEGIVLPAPVDLQVNGWRELDPTVGPDAAAELGRRLRAAGVAAWLWAVTSRDVAAYDALPPDLSTVPGCVGYHLEGPFLNPARRGAHPAEALRPPDPDLLRTWLDHLPVRVLTMAPELPGAHEVAAYAAERGVVVLAGHSDASTSEAIAALEGPFAGVTHIFNAMAPFHHRSPGLAGVALWHPAALVTFIPDGVHLADETVRLVADRAGPTVAVSDLVPGTPGPDGAVRTADGVLAGAGRSLADDIAVLRRAGVAWVRLARIVATTPADLLGLDDVGRIAPGARADWLVVDPTGRPLRVVTSREAC